jgi:hypothetical protein
MFDIGAIGVLALQDLVGGHFSIPKFALGGLSEALMVYGSTQYIKGDRRVLEATLDVHLLNLFDRFWDLPVRFRGSVTPEEAEEVRESMHAFFTAVRGEGVPAEVRLVLARQLYDILARLALMTRPD